MSTLLVSSFLPLLLLAWLPAGLTHQSADSSITISASELSFKCLLQVAPYNTTVEQFIDRIKNVTEEKVEIRFLYEKSNSDFGGVNETEHETRTATCTCEKRNTSTVEAGTNQTQQESDPETSPTSTPKPQTQEEIIYTYIIPGLVVSSFFFLFCILVCLCRRKQRNAKGKSESKHVAEMNQLSTVSRGEFFMSCSVLIKSS
ncbi:uncharacterized protein LOC118172848 isoform X1 [Oxyura jamaicensis]|uniref:uncharacterized protein LOC118172848 isoform X1 n=1 Tax=Oxyura jamaicensis TaxID=8884 RepID=UPI0015A5BDDA|nr:uncharacterized protein LOC118172848 isoform X1 [Oxyura jamaicensis]